MGSNMKFDKAAGLDGFIQSHKPIKPYFQGKIKRVSIQTKEFGNYSAEFSAEKDGKMDSGWRGNPSHAVCRQSHTKW